MGNCIFCEIVQGKLDANIIYEDDLILAFMDIDPINIGHILLVTKVHKLDVDELTEEEFKRIMDVSKLLVRVIKNKFNLDGYSIMQNGGMFNDIGHYHLHVFPRYRNDGFGWTYGEIEEHDIKEIGEELASYLSNFKETI